MADIFISYARADREKIETLASALEGEGYSVWWDRHIEGGAEFSKDIEGAIRAAKAVIVAWSVSSVESHWVRDEAVYARDHGKMIPIRLDDADAPMGFRQVQAIDFTTSDASALAALKRSVGLRLGADENVISAPVAASPNDPKPSGIDWRDPKTKAIAGTAIAVLIAGGVALMTMSPQNAPAIAPPAGLPPASEQGAATPPRPGVVTTVSSIGNNIVAVLPFANRSAKEDDAYFADGMHDDLLTKLSKISSLQVISRTSVMRFRDTEQPIPAIAEQLGAAVVMEGAVQRAGSRVRINVQLIDGETDQHLWAEIYDREMTAENIFDIQEEITHAIASALKAVLSDADEAELNKRPTQNVAAYNAYLRALAIAPQVYTISRDQIDRAISALDEAIELDPNFAPAHARKGYNQLMGYWLLGLGDEWRDAARESMLRAQALAPTDIETLYTQGYYHYWGELNYDGADAVFDRLLARAPNHAGAISAKAFTQRRRGNFQESLDGLLRVAEIDPLDISNFVEISDTAATTGQWDVSETALDRAEQLDPRHPSVAAYRFFLAKEMGDVAGAWQAINRPIDGGDHRHFQWRLQAATLTRSRENIEATLAAWPEALRTPESLPETYDLAKAEALYELGGRDEAMALLARAKDTIEAREVSYPGGWGPNNLIFPVLLPGLMGDLQTVIRLAGEFEADRIPDAQGNPSVYVRLAIAFARAGDPDRALGYIERVTEAQGVWRFAEFSITPAFDGLYDHPRWKSMEAQFDAWAAENERAQ